MPKTLGFALGAGGARGVAHVGFLKAMEEAGIVPDYLAGSSMGSVIGACYAAGMTADEMREALKSLRAGDVVDLGVPSHPQAGAFEMGAGAQILGGAHCGAHL